jgi:phosphoribosyl-AMP cyclohydrolase
MNNKKELEESLNFNPKLDDNGLIPCIATCAQSGDVLMFAFMNKEALEQTIKTGEAHYWSRSRKELWHKGATSGHIQKVVEMRTDCDQDCIWIKVETDVGSCHTGRRSCFYREITDIDTLEFKDADAVFDPKDVYKS